MENPIQIVNRVCEQKGVQPAEMLDYLLRMLRERHFFAAGFTFQDPKNKGSVLDEISSCLSACHPPRDMPPSLLATLDLMLGDQQAADAHNAKVHADAGQTAHAKGMERRAKAGEATLLVVRECMNQAERQGIQARLGADELRENRERGEAE